jgi:hypothetical protein
MNSEQFSNLYNIQEYTQPGSQNIEYYSPQPEIFQNDQIISSIQEISQPNYEINNQLNNNIISNQINTEYTDINNLYTENNFNEINSIPLTNLDNQTYQNIQFPETNIEQKTNYDFNNTANDNNIENINNNNMIAEQNLEKEEINNKSNNENNLDSNNEKLENEINLKNNINQKNSTVQEIQNNPDNQIEQEHKKVDISLHDPESTEKNQNNQDIASSQIPQINSSDLNQSFPNQEQDKIKSPEQIYNIDSNKINSPIIRSIHSIRHSEKDSKLNNDILNEEKEIYKDFTKIEEIFLRNKDDYKKLEFDFKSHFDLTLTKEDNKFCYKKVKRVITPLFGHFEMPDDLEYKSPLLSPNEKYLACIGTGKLDWVFVWEMSNLYWYKYKISFSKVDCITFTPDSKSLIIIYKNAIPLMYDLSTGKMILKFQKNGEEGIREGYQCSFTTNNTHFALSSTKSFTLWSLRNGKIRQRIIDNSPVKIICNEYLINVDSDLNCVIRKIIDQTIIHKFQIKGINMPTEILDGRCTEDMANFIYVIKHGIVIYNFKNNEYTGMQRFDSGVERATLSDDAKLIFKTNMKNSCINNLEKGTNICTLLKDEFKDYKIDYRLKKLITIDNISITIQDVYDENPKEKHIWLNKNPTKFIDVKISNEFDIILARISNTDAIVYDLKTGYILKKWENLDENWLDYAMTNSGGDRIAIKTNSQLVKIWNFITRREEATFYGYLSNSLCFSGDGYYLLCGGQKGSEIARIWDIEEQKFGSYRFGDSNDNINTKAHLTSPKPERVICCSEGQQPLIFDSYTKKLLVKCECPIKFEIIYDIQSDLMSDIFIVKGRDKERRNMGIMYKISDGTLLKIYENYTMLELLDVEKKLITKCQNINGGKLSSVDLKNMNEQLFHEFQIQTNKCIILNDNKTAIIQYGDQFSKEFNFINLNDGNFIGKLDYMKKIDRNAETILTVDEEENEIHFRYFEFLPFMDTIAYLKKNVFVVEGENWK